MTDETRCKIDPKHLSHCPSEPTQREVLLANDEAESYESRRANLLKQQEDMLLERDRAKIRADEYLVRLEERKGRPLTDEEIKKNYNFVSLLNENLKDIQSKLEFLRPKDKADMTYRLQVVRDLPALVVENTPSGLPLRFHGTPIYRARKMTLLDAERRGISSVIPCMRDSETRDLLSARSA